MMTVLLLTLVFGADRPLISDATLDEHGIRVHRVTSEFQAGETLIRVLLPEKLGADQRLKVLYLLPVEANTEHRYGDGLLEAKKLDLANTHRLICVAPTFSHLPWYADHPTDKTIRQESYFLKVVVPTIEKLYPVQAERDGRLLVGFSKSGYGAWSLLLRHPDQFAKTAAWDAPLMKTAPDQFGMGSIYGTSENFASYRIDSLLRDRVAELRPKTDKPTARLIHLGYGNFRDHHQRIEALLNELQIPHAYADGPKLEHTWHSGWLGEAVRQLVR
jgi:S-formylglutathione hydrolase FrmB